MMSMMTHSFGVARISSDLETKALIETPRLRQEAGRCFFTDILSLFEQDHRVLGGGEVVECFFELLVFISADYIVCQRHAR
jgi:hypothetical protein